MKKLLFAMAVLFGCSIMSMAQVHFVSTLQHEGTFTHYYGSGALSSAYGAAVAGDTITLSGGSFSFSGNFEKGITVRGTGTTADLPTVLTSEMNFYSKDANLSATFEGVRFNTTVNIFNSSSEQGQGKINFIKCFFSGKVDAANTSSYSTEKGPVTRFTNCVLTARMFFYANSYPYFTFANCYVRNPHCENGIKSNLTAFENCVIDYPEYYPLCSSAYYLSFYNSILVFSSNLNSSYRLPSTATAQNCLSINFGECFNNIYNNGTNRNSNSITDIFKTYTSGYSTSDNYALTDEAAKTYFGTDGTQIGINGGHAPFTQTVQYPVVTTLKANQTTKDGILNVEVGIDE